MQDRDVRVYISVSQQKLLYLKVLTLFFIPFHLQLTPSQGRLQTVLTDASLVKIKTYQIFDISLYTLILISQSSTFYYHIRCNSAE